MKIAITGGIGSGKSTVAKIYKDLGYKVCSCDEIYKELLLDENFVNVVCSAMQIPPISHENGIISIDKDLISQKVFNDIEAKKLLESITHPAIMKRANEICNNSDVCFVEVPLLFENGMEKDFDEVIVVLRAEEDRISAVVERDGLDRQKILNRIKNQINYENFSFIGHTVIYNDGDIAELKRKATDALEKILQK